MTVYHSSRDLFDKIDPEKLSNEGSVASYGAGLYTSADPDVTKGHLAKMGPQQNHGVMYEVTLDIEDSRTLMGHQKPSREMLEKGLETAKLNDNIDLQIAHNRWLDKLDSDDFFTGSEYHQQLGNHLGQHKASNFLAETGIDAIQYDMDGSPMYVVVNTDSAINNIKPVEVIGNGPRNGTLNLDTPKANTRDVVDANAPDVTGGDKSFWSKAIGKLGAVGSAAVSGYFLLKGDFAQAAENLPLGASAVAVAENRPTEAILSGIEETGIGLVATEIARPIAQSLGADVNLSLIHI